MHNIVKSEAARSDLVEIWSYIARDDADAADNLLHHIDAAFTLIAEHPHIGFSIDTVLEGVRCKPVTQNYLVFYAVLDDGTISILRVLHSARRWKD